MNGTLILNNTSYFYTFDLNTFKLSIYKCTKLEYFSNDGLLEDELKKTQFLEAIAFEHRYRFVKFKFRSVDLISLEKIVIKIEYYFELDKEHDEINGISYESEEMNSFFDINKAYERNIINDEGQIEIKLKKNEDARKILFFENDEILESLSFNYRKKLSYSKKEILTVVSSMQIKFRVGVDFDYTYKNSGLIYRLFSFLTYRKNIRFNSINLYVNVENRLQIVGKLNVFVNAINFYIENDDTIRNNLIKLDLIGEKLCVLVQAIKNDRIYFDHIPRNSAEKNHITPARFLMVTSAFEWEVERIYGDYKYSENQDYKYACDRISELLKAEIDTNKGKKKHYLETLARYFKYSGISLSEKIIYALKKNEDSLKPFIEYLYQINNVDLKDSRLVSIANRIETQRNNYAHGKIDKEINLLVCLDFVVLEWLNYSLVLTELGIDDLRIKQIINTLFGRFLQIE